MRCSPGSASSRPNSPPRGKTASMKEELARKDQIIAGLQQRLFGKSSERLDPNQLDLDFDDATLGKPEPLPETGDTGAAPEEAGGKRKRHRRKKADLFPKNLPVVIEEIIIPAEVEADPAAWREIGEEHHDELDVTRASLFWRRKTCKKFVRTDDAGAPPVMCPMPEPSLPGTLCAPRPRRPDHHRKTLRPPAALPAEQALQAPPRHQARALHDQRLDATPPRGTSRPSALAIRRRTGRGQATCRSTRRRSTTSAPATARRRRATSGSTTRPNSNSPTTTGSSAGATRRSSTSSATGRPGGLHTAALDCDGYSAYETYLRLRGEGVASAPASPTSAGSSTRHAGKTRPPPAGY